MRGLQARAHPCNALFITRNEQIMLGSYSDRVLSTACLAVSSLPSAMNSFSTPALPSWVARAKHAVFIRCPTILLDIKLLVTHH